ncbi:diguanylate cyclase [Paenibacillus sp. SYP-B3998]|uniref:Diguanylate cyclase n=1 Tax=Paenibacillus sp. SYP-B3998 TaxID=2678564 RepID=A0A6G3ZWT9_9BACL|nr:diguanylate cyclase [Paenibacillus sp. SYP-B3998]
MIEVLYFIVQMMKSASREEDLCCRFGGEEFILLLEETEVRLSNTIAERLREKIASMRSPTGKSITISIGVADNSDHPGRNRTVIAPAPVTD